MSIFLDQKAFMVACDQVIAGGLNVETRLWERLIREESRELFEELEAFHMSPSLDNIAKLSKEAIDLIYVIAGLLNNLSVPADLVWNLVHASNMAKVDPASGKVIKRADGKILKPEGWQAPDVLALLLEDRHARS